MPAIEGTVLGYMLIKLPLAASQCHEKGSAKEYEWVTTLIIALPTHIIHHITISLYAFEASFYKIIHKLGVTCLYIMHVSKYGRHPISDG